MLSDESMTNSAYVKNNGVDLLYKLVFCDSSASGVHFDVLLLLKQQNGPVYMMSQKMLFKLA